MPSSGPILGAQSLNDDTHINDLLDVLRGALGALSGFVVRFGARISFLFIAGNIFGAERLGTYAYSIAIVETFAAIAIFGQKRSLFALLEKDAPAGSARESQLAFSAILLSLALSLMFACFLYFWGWQALAMDNSTPFSPLFAFVIPLIAVSEVFLSLTRHRRKIRYDVMARSITEPWVLTGLVVAAWALNMLDGGLLAAYFGALVASFAVSLWGLARLYHLPTILRAGTNAAYLRELSVFSAPTAAVDVIALAFRRVDIFLLGVLSSEAVVGIYYAAQNIATLVQKTRHIFDPILAPVVSQTMTRRGHDQAAKQLEQVCRWIFTILAIQVVLLGFFAGALLDLVGTGMAVGALALILMMVAEALDGSIASAELPIVYRHPRFNLGLSLVAFGVHVAGCYLLIPAYGVTGAAASLLISLGTLNILRIYFAQRLLDIWVLSPAYLKPAFAMGMTLGALILLDRYVDLHDALTWPIGVLLAFVVYLGMIKMMGISEEGRALVAQLRNKS